MDSRIEITATGKTILHVWYDNAKRDWNQAIDEAIRHHGLDRRTTMVIARPNKSQKVLTRQTNPQGLSPRDILPVTQLFNRDFRS